VKLELGRLQGGQSLTSRLSFRAKLLLVLFVPFLALVVVAAAGLSDRFAALHAQEQYGDLSGPLSTLESASRALQNESVVSSWYVGSGGAPAAELEKARSRTNDAVREFRLNEQAFANAGLSPTALGALDAANRGFDSIGAERAKVDDKTATPAAVRDFFLVSTTTSSTSVSASRATWPVPTSRRVSPGCSHSSARSMSTHAKPACTSPSSRAAHRRASASGSVRRPRSSSTSQRSATPRRPRSSLPSPP